MHVTHVPKHDPAFSILRSYFCFERLGLESHGCGSATPVCFVCVLGEGGGEFMCVCVCICVRVCACMRGDAHVMSK